MFETGPFIKCPRCKNEESLGILSVGGQTLTRRCKDCRFSYPEGLPPLDKKVVYLDQFAISELFKTKTKTRRVGAAHEDFWKDFLRLADIAYLRQQVIFPASNLHSDETIVWHSASDLKLAHAMLSGETSFESTDDVAAEHEQMFAETYLRQAGPPEITFDVDDVLEGERNVWIPKFHIDVRTDFSVFAPGIRTDRASAEASLKALADRWANEKPTFDAVLKEELASYGPATKQALVHAIAQANKAIMSRLVSGKDYLLTILMFIFQERFGFRGNSRQLLALILAESTGLQVMLQRAVRRAAK